MAKITIPSTGLWGTIAGYFNSMFDELYGDTGWASYQDDTYTVGSPFSLSADTDTNLPNDAGTTNETQKPTYITTLYDESVTKITGRNGDAIMITLEYKVDPTSATNTYIDTWIDIGGSVGELYRRTTGFNKGLSVYNVNISFLAYTLDTWESNGGQVKVRSNTTCDIYDVRFVVAAIHRAR